MVLQGELGPTAFKMGTLSSAGFSLCHIFKISRYLLTSWVEPNLLTWSLL